MFRYKVVTDEFPLNQPHFALSLPAEYECHTIDQARFPLPAICAAPAKSVPAPQYTGNYIPYRFQGDCDRAANSNGSVPSRSPRLQTVQTTGCSIPSHLDTAPADPRFPSTSAACRHGQRKAPSPYCPHPYPLKAVLSSAANPFQNQNSLPFYPHQAPTGRDNNYRVLPHRSR